MIVLGLLLLLLVIVVVVAVVLNGGDPVQLSLQGFTVNTDVTGIFVAGAATVLVGVFGASLLMSGLKRARRKRAEVNALKAQAARKEPKPLGGSTSSGRADQTRTTAVSSPPQVSSPTQADQRSTDDGDGTDEHFESAPRDR